MKHVTEPLAPYELIDELRLELAHAKRMNMAPAIICDIHDRLMTAYGELEAANVTTIIDRIDYKNVA